jgi:hypothetical protein
MACVCVDDESGARGGFGSVPVHCRRLAKYLTRDSSTSVAEREGRGHTHHLLALGYMTTSDPSGRSHTRQFLPHISQASQASFLVTGKFDGCYLCCCRIPYDRKSDVLGRG